MPHSPDDPADMTLSERARQRAMELAADSDIRLTAPRMKPSNPEGITKVSTIARSIIRRIPRDGWSEGTHASVDT